MSAFFNKRKSQARRTMLYTHKRSKVCIATIIAGVVTLEISCSPLSNIKEDPNFYNQATRGVTISLSTDSAGVRLGSDGGGMAVADDGTIYSCSALNGTSASGCLPFRLPGSGRNPLKHGNNALIVTSQFILTTPENSTDMVKCPLDTLTCAVTSAATDVYGGIKIRAPDDTIVFRVDSARDICHAAPTHTLDSPGSQCTSESLSSPWIVDLSRLEEYPRMSATQYIIATVAGAPARTAIVPINNPSADYMVSIWPESGRFGTAFNGQCDTISRIVSDHWGRTRGNAEVCATVAMCYQWSWWNCRMFDINSYCHLTCGTASGGGSYKLYRPQ